MAPWLLDDRTPATNTLVPSVARSFQAFIVETLANALGTNGDEPPPPEGAALVHALPLLVRTLPLEPGLVNPVPPCAAPRVPEIFPAGTLGKPISPCPPICAAAGSTEIANAVK